MAAVWGFRALMMWSSLGSEQAFGAYFWGETVGGSSIRKLRFYLINSDGTLTNSHEAVTTGGTNALRSLGEWTTFTSASGATYLLVLTHQTIGGAATFVPKAYDGTSWTTPAITNVPVGTMGVHAHRNRLWFYGTVDSTNAPKGLSAWYLPVGAIAGAVVEFNIGPFASKGGRIVAMRTWTLDGGEGGTDDLAVFLTDRGQAIIYQGTDPSSSSTWGLVGVFDVGKPASIVATDVTASSYTAVAAAHTDSFAMKYGADVVMLLEDGVTSAERVLRPHDEGKDYSLSAKIRSLLTDAAVTYGALSASNPVAQWKMVYFGARKQLIVAIPGPIAVADGLIGVVTIAATDGFLYVMNSETGAWTKFTGINIWDALVVGNLLYFIDGGQSVYKYGVATSDNSVAITYEARQAYNYLASPNNKHVTLMQPMLLATGNFSLTVEADADFNGGTISTYTNYTVASTQNLQPWLSANKYGRAIAAHLKGQTTAGVVSWYATNWIAKPAGMI